ncbi:hypothetical protein ACQ27_gp511 [Klebsiella phage K64-1]|uniref:hypothetical protein n=1 Tax=Klebsiella phage K64-1 TaxID=1439894 RepID=UPI00248BF041|nr:hypothetical protein ACQ27_gp511 [Klebsiella phage K64-1]
MHTTQEIQIKLKINNYYNNTVSASYNEEVLYEINYSMNDSIFTFREYNGITLIRSYIIPVIDYTEMQDDELFQYSLIYDLEHVIPFDSMVELQGIMKLRTQLQGEIEYTFNTMNKKNYYVQ